MELHTEKGETVTNTETLKLLSKEFNTYEAEGENPEVTRISVLASTMK